MQRKIIVERLYPLGDYKNIKLIEEVSEIPEELANNSDYMEKLRKSVMASVELGFYDYVTMLKTMASHTNSTTTVKYLDEIRNEIFED